MYFKLRLQLSCDFDLNEREQFIDKWGNSCPFLNHNATITIPFDVDEEPPTTYNYDIPKLSSIVEDQLINIKLPSDDITCNCDNHDVRLAIKIIKIKLSENNRSSIIFSKIINSDDGTDDGTDDNTDDSGDNDNDNDMEKCIPYDELTNKIEIDCVQHWYCWCKQPGAKDPCGCGCDKHHDGW